MANNGNLRLFEVNDMDGYKVILNREWIGLIPQFNMLLKKDKGSDGDYRGDKKLYATKQFTFIYHMLDPRSPLENVDVEGEVQRRAKALEYAELTERDVASEEFIEAMEEYEYLLEYAVPSLPLLRSAKGTMKKLTHHFNTIDFGEKDAKGQLVHNPGAHIKNVQMLKSLHLSIKEFDNMVMEELKQSKGIRGSATMGDRESGVRKAPTEWKESGPAVIEQDFIEGLEDSDKEDYGFQ